MVPEHDPIVVFAMVTALIVTLAVGIFFASPLRTLLTGPDEPPPPELSGEPDPPDLPPPADMPDGPWSTAAPIPDGNWPAQPTHEP